MTPIFWTARQLDSSEAKIRRRAVEKLGLSGKARAVRHVIRVLGDRDLAVQRAGENALERLRHIARQPLLDALTGWDRQARPLAARGLRVIADKQAIPPLIAAMQDGDSEVRLLAADVLDSMGWEPANPEEHAAHAIAFEKWSDAAALGAGAVVALTRRVRDVEERVQLEAMRALAQIGDPAGIDALIGVLTRWHGSRPTINTVTLAAAAALRAVGPGWVEAKAARSRVGFFAGRFKNRDEAQLAWGPLLTIGLTVPELILAVIRDDKEDALVRAVALGVARRIVKSTGLTDPDHALKARQEQAAEMFDDTLDALEVLHDPAIDID